MESHKESRENGEQKTRFLSDYNEIINRSLTVDDIDTYADDALDDLIALCDRIVESYQNELMVDFDTSRKFEDSAFDYYDIPGIDPALDHIGAVSRELRSLDSMMNAKMEHADKIVTPPDSRELRIAAGSGAGISERVKKPKLKTILFILQNNFEIDIDDPDGTKLTKGVVASNMMRQTSYVLVEIPSLNRSILVCDEEGNATFVIDSSLLGENTIQQERLIDATKDELNSLIDTIPGFGKRIIESKNYFVPRIIDAIEDLSQPDDLNVGESGDGKYLESAEPAPEGVMTMTGISKGLGVSRHSVIKAIRQLKESGVNFDEKRYDFSNHILVGYGLEAQRQIRQKLEENGLFDEFPPEGTLTINGMAEEFGNIERVTLSRVIDQMRDSGFGFYEKIYRFRNGKTAVGYSPEAQVLIKQELEKRGFNAEPAPEGVMTNYELAKKLNASERTISKIAMQLEHTGIDSGKKSYRFGGRIAVGYEVWFQDLIKQELDKKRDSLAKPAPEGILSVAGMTKKLGATDKTINNLIMKLGDAGVDLGGEEYSFGGANNTIGYDERAQELIRQKLEESRNDS